MGNFKKLYASAFVGTMLMAHSSMGMAAEGDTVDISSSLLSSFGCSIYKFLTGPLAVWAFILVVIGTLLIGLVAKVDFAKIITVIVIFALIQGVGTWAFQGGMPGASDIGASCLEESNG